MTDLCRRPGTILTLAVLALLTTDPLGSWEYTEFSLDGEVRLAMMADAGIFNPYLEVKGVFHGSETAFRYNSYTAGTYFKVSPWLKLGVFYRLQGGLRHLEDWTVVNNPDPTPDEHWWDDVSPLRSEHLVLADATPRFLMPWMPGGNWVAALKIRYAYNFFNGNQTLLARPGVTWVMMRDREPVLNLGLQYPVYFALNFNDTPIYGHGPYLTALWHINRWMKMEGRLTWLVKNYSKTEQGGPWILHSHHLGLGFGLVFTPDIGG